MRVPEFDSNFTHVTNKDGEVPYLSIDPSYFSYVANPEDVACEKLAFEILAQTVRDLSLIVRNGGIKTSKDISREKQRELLEQVLDPQEVVLKSWLRPTGFTHEKFRGVVCDLLDTDLDTLRSYLN